MSNKSWRRLPQRNSCGPFITREPGDPYPPSTATAIAQRVMQDEASDMRRFVRSSASALAAALGVAAACAAWQSGGPLRSARLAKPRVPTVSFVPAAPADGSQAQRAVLGSAYPGDADCEQAGCADGLAAEAAEFCAVCLDPTDLALSGLDRSSLDEWATPLAISLAALLPSSPAIRIPCIWPVSGPPRWPPRRPKSQPRRC